jgi:hypothetical protein
MNQSGEDETLGNCVAAFPAPKDSRCVGVVLHPNGDDMSNLSELITDCYACSLSQARK